MSPDILFLSDQRPLCGWVNDAPLCIAYHDQDWGTPICYAFMQAVGMVNDHLIGCYRYKEVGEA